MSGPAAVPLPLPPARRVPAPPPPSVRSGTVLLAQARSSLVEARAAGQPGERYAAAHLAALRCAAAVVALRARPDSGRRRPTNAWVLLAGVAPEFGDWAAYFAAGAGRRAAVEAGAVRSVTTRDANDLLRAAEEFAGLVEGVVLAGPASRAS
ncbi:SAV_6107 family HEPN domain-containing protein [Jatrophihabitans sp. YIM 134969]